MVVSSIVVPSDDVGGEVEGMIEGGRDKCVKYVK